MTKRAAVSIPRFNGSEQEDTGDEGDNSRPSLIPRDVSVDASVAAKVRTQGTEFWSSLRDSALWRRARETWAGEFYREQRRFAREIYDWFLFHRSTLPNVKDLRDSIAALRASVPDSVDTTNDKTNPIFLLSTGWRTGSTLLQRIVVTDPRVFLWGEPLGEMTVVSRIVQMLDHSLSNRDLKLWYGQPSLDTLNSSLLATSWIATLSPNADDFRQALRDFFDRWLGDPVHRAGHMRWGFKEVRLSGTDACLLHWLYPNAKFVILSRHPYDCYISLSDANFRPLYYRYPSVRVDSAVGFASHWNKLALSWLELPEGFPAFHIKYEDLISGDYDFRKLEAWLGIEIDEDIALSVTIGHSSKRPRLSWYERKIIAHEAAAGMRALGYPK
jgi:hypothetical protein